MSLLVPQLAHQIAQQISDVTGEPFAIASQRSVAGGCISQAIKVSDSQRSFFVKLNRTHPIAAQLAMFEAERDGLSAMYDTHTIRVPQPLCCGQAEDCAFIVIEWLDLAGRGNEAAWQRMGEQLAAMHLCGGEATSKRVSPPGFGWHRDNTIGATPQQNGWLDSWVEFWRDRRLGPQFELAHDRGGRFPRRDELISAVPRLLKGHTPKPALLHGDLWSGNAAITESGEPVILDPATYYGDSEADLAMTELFGRFPGAFYAAYNAVKPIAAGYERRKVLYNLYHILNHFNLFGGSYSSQANSMINQILDWDE